MCVCVYVCVCVCEGGRGAGGGAGGRVNWGKELSLVLVFHALKGCSWLSLKNSLRICLGTESRNV